MSKLKVLCLAFCLGIVPYHLAAAGFDGSTPLLCATIEVFECGSGDECQRSSPKIANIPQFIRVNAAEKTISAADESGRKATLKHIEHLNGNMIIQGVGNGRGWSIVIAEETGKLSASVAGDQVAFAIFGACTPQ
jgi:hypothetical protein